MANCALVGISKIETAPQLMQDLSVPATGILHHKLFLALGGDTHSKTRGVRSNNCKVEVGP